MHYVLALRVSHEIYSLLVNQVEGLNMILYSDVTTRKTYVEFWGASTKHPDSRNCYQYDIEDKKFIESPFQHIEWNILQWLMYVASIKTFVFHAMELLDDIKYYYDVLL